MSPVSTSSADTAAPMFVFVAVFSAMERSPVSVAGNVGALFGGGTGVSSTSVTVIVTSMSVLNSPSDTRTLNA